MFKYDTAHGRYAGSVTHNDGKLVIDGHGINIFNEYVGRTFQLQISKALDFCYMIRPS